jgi:hypothetical protein
LNDSGTHHPTNGSDQLQAGDAQERYNGCIKAREETAEIKTLLLANERLFINLQYDEADLGSKLDAYL